MFSANILHVEEKLSKFIHFSVQNRFHSEQELEVY